MQEKQIRAALGALIGIRPKDELEGMMAAQLIAAHNAAMECFRRAMIGEQRLEGRRDNLAQANKLTRTRHAARSAQSSIAAKASRRSPWSTFTSIPVARRWWASWSLRGLGIARNWRSNPMQGKLPMHLSPRCGARTKSGSACQSPAMPNGRCCMHGGPLPGAPKSNRNAFKHEAYPAPYCDGKPSAALSTLRLASVPLHRADE